MFNGKQYWMCEKRGFTKVYGRVGDEDLVGNVLRLSGQRLASEGIPGELSKFQNSWLVNSAACGRSGGSLSDQRLIPLGLPET